MGLKIEDLEKITMVTDPKISPDGRRVVFVVTKASIKENKYFSTLWIYDLEKKSLYNLTNGPFDISPFWSSDSRKIAYLSRKTLKDEEPGLELWIIDLENPSSPRLVFKHERSFQIYGFVPNTQKVLINVTEKKTDEGKEKIKVIDEVPFWFNGEGYIYGQRNALYIVDSNTGNAEKITQGDEEISFAQVSPDGQNVAYISAEDHQKPYKTDLKVVNIYSKETRKLTKGEYIIEDLAWESSAKHIAFRASDYTHGLNSHTKLWIIDLTSTEIRRITLPDWDISNSMNSDMRGPSSLGKLQWSGKWLYFPFNKGGTVSLLRTDAVERIEAVVEGDFTVEDFSANENTVALTIMSSTRPSELYILRGRKLEKVTDFNDELIEKAKLQRPIHFKAPVSDGNAIDCWLLKPSDFKEGQKYPTILYIHGGPATAYGESFMHEFHVLSSEGFAVLYTNPRGSAGYTEDFKDIRGKYGTRDYLDLMEALDYAIKSFPFIDENRLGVAGGSYGGFMTNWIIGQTDRFKAAVTMRSISNWLSFYGTSDIGYYFSEDQISGELGKNLWTEGIFEIFWQKSPLKYANRVKTPTLIIHSDEDYRCWIDQAYQFFTALKLNGVETKLVIFPGENHDLSRKGKPKNRVERLRYIVEWFKTHLK